VEIRQDLLQGSRVRSLVSFLGLGRKASSPYGFVPPETSSDFEFSAATVEKSRLARGEVWRVRVLEFVLERRRFYPPVVNATVIAENHAFTW
jgi:hypothetical protein